MDGENPKGWSRRRMLGGLLGVGAAAAGANAFGAVRFLEPLHVENPLAHYPDRDWEKHYRNLFKADSSFVFLCAPNDTHNCLLKAHVKNGVITRIGPTYGYGKAKDLYGNHASSRWDPRLCQKGLALVRRIYGDRRVKGAMVRRGFKEWADAGYPRDPATGRPDAKYFQRGKDKWLRIGWDEAYQLSARTLDDIARTYSGDEGATRLNAQGYDPAMVETMHGAGTQTFKLRGGMAFLGATRIFGVYRLANVLALADAHIREVPPEEAYGARGMDSYSWHTDLPPGHPMVTGVQTNDFELFAVEHSKLCLVWGMNWITTKMPDSHWLTEARLKGTKVVAVTVEYSSTASKSDDVVVIRPGTDPAFALGLAQVIISRRLFDPAFVAQNTDLPFLIRLDTLQPLRPEEVLPDYRPSHLWNVGFMGQDPQKRAVHLQADQTAPEGMADQFQGFVIWDAKSQRLAPVTRNDFGPAFARTGFSPQLSASRKVQLLSGETVEVETNFRLIERYLDASMTPAQVAQITGAPAEAIVSLAEQIAQNKEKTLFVTGMGPNQFFNADLKDRAIFLVAALTRNVGFPGGNVGSYSGNYRSALFGGISNYTDEDPFELATDPAQAPSLKKYMKYESLHYFNYGDRPLRQGNHLFTGKGHLPTPTKVMWLNNSNSVIGNVKWHYDVIVNTLPKLEFVALADWWWTGSCEYADLVFGCDSWAEFQHLDMTASGTNPFVQLYPKSPLKRIFDTRADIEIIAGVSKALGELYGDRRFADAWKFVDEGKVEVYLQRIIDGTPALRGYRIEELARLAEQGIPALMNNRTYPRISSFEQSKGEQPWHTRSGRLELYRPEQDFIDSGENMIVYREPVDSTFHEPNVIVAHPHGAIRPKGPEAYGLARGDLSVEARQVRNVVLTPEEMMRTRHPLMAKRFGHIYHTPKYRHGAHTTPVDSDFNAVLFGPFGDVYRQDRRQPAASEGYVDINPADARALEVEDGDYVWIDADPEDRPYRNPQVGSDATRLSRLLLRARYYPGTPRGIARTWHNMYGATYGTVAAHDTRDDKLARNAETQYQAMYRYGSHQSATRAWLRPTLMTETLVRKDMYGQQLGIGFAADIHCPVGAPREAFVRISRAESGGMRGEGLWRPAALGYRPTYENEPMRAYLAGNYIRIKA